MSEMTTLEVGLGSRSYPIFIGKGLLERASELITPFVRSRKAFIVTDTSVAPLYLKRLEENLRANGFESFSIAVEASEKSKSFACVEDLAEKILEAGCDRHSFLIALGGGVVGDLAGFCASILLRGIDLIQMPTTLLSQVDSSVGGKTAINVKAGKNLVGSFYQPKTVLIDIETLKTLDERQLRAGYAEIVKYGLILRPDFWNWLELHGMEVLEQEEEACRFAIEQSCRTKADIVAADELEENDVRALLNFGHTFGHAFEAQSGMDGSILHGEGVAVGCLLAAELSVRLEMCPPEVPERMREHFEKAGLLKDFSAFHVSDLMSWMKKDKKNVDSHFNLVLLQEIGKAILVKDVAPDEVRKVLELYTGGKNASIGS